MPGVSPVAELLACVLTLRPPNPVGPEPVNWARALRLAASSATSERKKKNLGRILRSMLPRGRQSLGERARFRRTIGARSRKRWLRRIFCRDARVDVDVDLRRAYEAQVGADAVFRLGYQNLNLLVRDCQLGE